MPETSTIPLHPLLGSLHQLTSDLDHANKRLGERADAADSSYNWLVGDRWTPLIEGALEKPTELEAVRVEYDEAVVTYFYHGALSRQAHSRRIALREQLRERLREAVSFHATLSRGHAHYRLKTPFEAAIVDGARAEWAPEPKRKHYAEHPDRRNTSRRFYNILVQAYRAFVTDELARVNNPRKYPTGPAVPGKKYQSHLNADVDLRRINPLDFDEDCVNEPHPHSARLATLLAEMDQALAVATASIALTKTRKGEVNERQHHVRLVDVLHGATITTTVENLAAVEAQNVRRVAFETARQFAFIHLEILANLRDQVLEEVKLATVEAEPLIALTMQDNEIVTVDKWQVAPVIMLNCLAADQRLRRVTRSLETMREASNDDITGGIARRMIGEKFAEVAPRYRAEPRKPSDASDGYST
ncbi:MAG: hypothetical protein K2X93_08985 [Candidatus Obscuribacterales bacterium]|nr:hypothetical protein [Candidatus Obscuribacterales bacterium]